MRSIAILAALGRPVAGGLMAERSLHVQTVGPDAMPDGGPAQDGG